MILSKPVTELTLEDQEDLVAIRGSKVEPNTTNSADPSAEKENGEAEEEDEENDGERMTTRYGDKDKLFRKLLHALCSTLKRANKHDRVIKRILDALPNKTPDSRRLSHRSYR
ncbi:hypothetical protein BGZ65_000625 [Modicella reniformis]|uniref:Uncharacterized protein n=1 Tax=Modicella reniformis TaxID=1440133 RepID=A0A9P6IJ65_9FUNG|nr:hypothetical protein BGZ65_000625 [Modicella reniformis]